jgi:hypothetical protein
MITFSNPAICRFQAGSALGGRFMSAPGLASSAPDMFELLPMDIDEWYRKADDDINDDGRGSRLHEKGKTKVATTVEVILEAGGGSQYRAYRKPAVKTHTDVNTKSKAVRHRADMLMTPSAHGGGDQHLHVSSIQQELTVITTREELPLVEGSMQGATSGQRDSLVQQEGTEIELKTTKNDLIYIIPKRLKKEFKRFLDATSEDFERGTLHMLKCKLCHRANLKTWGQFTRHCNTSESHPRELLFCNRCGDFFARLDSLQRHSHNRATECCDVAPHEVEAKRNETMAIHKEFKNNTKAYLETNQGSWTPFAQVVYFLFFESAFMSRSRSSRRGIRTLRRDSRSETGNRVVAKHPSRGLDSKGCQSHLYTVPLSPPPFPSSFCFCRPAA